MTSLKVVALALVAMLAVGCGSGAAIKPNPPSPSPSLSPLPSPVCTTSAAKGACYPYTYSQITSGPNGLNSGNENKTSVGNNMFSSGTQTLHASSPGDWEISANWPAGNTGVETYPSLSADYHELVNGTWITRPLSSLGSMVSSFNETMNATSKTSAWAMYDIWMGSGDEVMIQHDFANNGYCHVVATMAFGGSYGVPVRNWHLCDFGTAMAWKLGTDDNNKVSEQSGSIDILGMLTWLENHGYLPRNDTLGAIGYGWEICSTGGVNENFQVSKFSITTTPPGSGQPPAVTTNAATSATATSATLNGSVNRDGQATTYQFEYGTTTRYGSSVPSPAEPAGDGTSAGSESAYLTGLRQGTTYHYRIKATNATGSAYGSDQMFTTSVNASGSVASGATGPSRSGAKCAKCATLDWNHPVSGSYPAVLVGVAVGAADDSGLDVSATDNGRPMTLLKTVHTDNKTAGFLDVFGLLNAPEGTNVIRISVSGGTAWEITGGSESFDNVARWGNIASAYGYGGTARVTSPGSTPDGIMAGFMACRSGVLSAGSPSTSRYIANEDRYTGAGNSAGATRPSTGSPVTLAWSNGSDYWGAIAVEAQPGSSGSR